ncbi:MAG: hypothetical protein GXP30_09955, partial [Verrucomicrobia bacterium]|nr:hypothetical protein [Verrucomicrobiota bacterium]
MSLRITVVFMALFMAHPVLAEQEITFTEHIAPIVYSRCVSCHREGESAPFQLIEYADAKRRARTIVKVVNKRYMPPWHAVDGDVKFHGDRRLSESQIELINRWVKQGMPEGDKKLLPQRPSFPSAWPLGEPDLILEMDEAYEVKAEGPDIYRNFVISTGLTKGRWLKAIAFKAGSPSVVHHSLFSLDTTGAARKANEREDETGFSEMPLGSRTGKSLGGWVPGAETLPLPNGLAHRIPAGSDIVLSIHFHLSGKPERERSRIGLYFGDKAPTKKFTGIQLPPVFGAFVGIDLPPGDKKIKIVDSIELPVRVEAFGVMAHAHYLGKSVKLTAVMPNGSRKILLNVPRWDFNWQQEYRFAEAVSLPVGTRLVTEIVWDNSDDNPDNPSIPPKRVRWGLESFNEMGSIILYVAVENDQQLRS